MANFDVALNWTLNFEDPLHKYATTPDSPQGSYVIAGVNSASWPRDFATINALETDYRPAAVARFYREEFWNTWLDRLNSDEVAKRVFDAGVNMGSGTAVRLLQGVLGCAVDGKWGPSTVSFANANTSQTLVANFILARCQHYKDIVANNPNDAKYLEGWISRAEK
jgi:lysozyme family protein